MIISDQDPDPTGYVISDPDPTCQVIPDPDPDIGKKFWAGMDLGGSGSATAMHISDVGTLHNFASTVSFAPVSVLHLPRC